MLSKGPAHTVCPLVAGRAQKSLEEGWQLNSNLCEMSIGTQTIPIRELKSHLHSSMKLPMASTARLVRLGLIFWNLAPGRLSHMTGLFASLCS